MKEAKMLLMGKTPDEIKYGGHKWHCRACGADEMTLQTRLSNRAGKDGITITGGYEVLHCRVCTAECSWDNRQDVGDTRFDDAPSCCLCARPIPSGEHGNNARPLADGVCCNACNYEKVLPERMRQMRAACE